MSYDNLVNGSCFRFEKNLTDTIIRHAGRHITCDVKGNCCLAFSWVGKREGLKFMNMKVQFNLNGKIKIGFVKETRDGNDQDYDWKEYLIKYSWFKKPIWVGWWNVWFSDEFNKF